MVQESFSGLGVKRKKDQEPKSALTMFAKIMGTNMDNLKEVEFKKLKLEEEKFAHSKELEDKKIDLEERKVQ